MASVSVREAILPTAKAVQLVAQAICPIRVVVETKKRIVLRVGNQHNARSIGNQFSMAGYGFDVKQGNVTSDYFLQVACK